MTGKKIAAHDFIIDANGGLSSWCITRADSIEGRYSTLLDKNDKPHWLTKYWMIRIFVRTGTAMKPLGVYKN